MGWFIGRYVYQTHMSHLAHKHASFMPMILPQFDASQHGYGVICLFGGSGANAAFVTQPGLAIPSYCSETQNSTWCSRTMGR